MSTYYVGPGRRLRPEEVAALAENYEKEDADLTIPGVPVADMSRRQLKDLANMFEEGGDQAAAQEYRAELARRQERNQ